LLARARAAEPRGATNLFRLEMVVVRLEGVDDIGKHRRDGVLK
jgi:hypothetical protein